MRHQTRDQTPSPPLESSTNLGTLVKINFGALVSALGTSSKISYEFS